MAEDKIIHAHVTETEESAYSVDIEVSGHHIKGDEPVESGGGNLGPSPFDMLLAALGECTTITVRWYAKRQNWPLDKVEVKLTHQKENKVDTYTKQVILHGDQLSEEQRAKLLDVAAKCPVQRALEGTPVITTTLS